MQLARKEIQPVLGQEAEFPLAEAVLHPLLVNPQQTRALRLGIYFQLPFFLAAKLHHLLPPLNEHR